MVRKLSLAIALALGVTPFSASALGLGDIKSNSSLNQKFNADIELLSVGTDEIRDIRAILASEEVFAKAGLNRPYFLSQLKFKPVRLANGKDVIRVTSGEPVREPFLNFLVEVNWPKGRLYREYTVLLDPPTTLRRAPAPVQPARIAARPAAKPVVETPARMEPPAMGPGEYGPTQRNDTLWNIAKEVRHNGTSMEQMVMALFQANPQAFIRRNINNLKVGQILRVPEREEVLSITAREARTQFWDQVNNWRARRDDLPAGEAPAVAAEEPSPAEQPMEVADDAAGAAPAVPQAELKIARTQSGEEGGESVSDSVDVEGTPGELQQELITAREMRESALEESKELKGRVESLASQLEDLQRLLELKDEQLARLQVALGDKPEAADSGEAAAIPPAEEQGVATMSDEQSAPQAEETVMVDGDGEEAMPLVDSPDSAVDEMTQPAADAEIAPDQPEMAGAEEETVEIEGDIEQVAEPPEIEVAQPLVEPEPEVEEKKPTASEQSKTTPVTPAEPVKPIGPAAFLDQLSEHPLVKKVTGDPVMMGIGAGVVILVLALLWLLLGRRSKEADQFQESILVDTADGAPSIVDNKEMEQSDTDASVSEETSFLSDFTPSEIDVLPEETGEVDPLAEADVYIAYGRYGQAESLVRQGLERTPDNLELKLKLFEILFAVKNTPAFTELAQASLDAGLPVNDPGAWESIATMGAKLAPGNSMFESNTVGDDGLQTIDDNAIDEFDNLDLGDLSASLDLDQQVKETLNQAEAEGMDRTQDKAGPGGTMTDGNLESALDLDLDALDGDDQPDLKSIAQDLIADGSLDEPSLTRDTEEVLDLPALEMDDLPDVEEALSLDEVADQAPAETLADTIEERLELPEVESLSESLGLPEEPDMGAASDEINTKLDLARAYVEMGDEEGARSILQEVVNEGGTGQQAEAKRLLDSFS